MSQVKFNLSTGSTYPYFYVRYEAMSPYTLMRIVPVHLALLKAMFRLPPGDTALLGVCGVQHYSYSLWHTTGKMSTGSIPAITANSDAVENAIVPLRALIR